MTTRRIKEPPATNPSDNTSPPSPVPRRAALIGGLALLVMAIVAGWANFIVIEGLTTPGDAAATARDIAASEGTFRLGVAAFAVVAILDVVVAWALYEVFKSANRGVSAVAGWMRAVYGAVLAVATAQLLGALGAVSDAEVLDSVEAFQDIWNAGLALFAVHLLLIGWLAWQLGGAPRVIGALTAIAGVGYLIDALGTFLVADYSLNVAMFTFIGELVLMAWLLLQARTSSS
jgi:hypothetical protein